MIRKCAVDEAVQLVNGTEEIGFLDLREIGPYSEGHPLFAVPVPFSVFEERVTKLVPRPGSRLLLIDVETESLLLQPKYSGKWDTRTSLWSTAAYPHGKKLVIHFSRA